MPDEPVDASAVMSGSGAVVLSVASLAVAAFSLYSGGYSAFALVGLVLGVAALLRGPRGAVKWLSVTSVVANVLVVFALPAFGLAHAILFSHYASW